MNRRADAASQSEKKVSDGNVKQRSDKKEKSKKAVYIYIATLFGVVLIFILLSYFIQLRNNSEASSKYEKNATAMQKTLQYENIQLQTNNNSDKDMIIAF